MGDNGKYVFMLPHLIQKNLVEDDSSHYALLSYPRDVISNATSQIVHSILKNEFSVSLASKKRIKFLMEYLAIALSLTNDKFDYMEVSRKIYHSWLEDSSLFGDEKRQNKYIRRIITQLSMPFEMREIQNQSSFQTKFFTLLMNILDDYEYLYQNRGNFLEVETWTLLTNVLIGICDFLFLYNLNGRFPKDCAEKLRQKSVDVLLHLLEISGIKDDKVWKKVGTYYTSWCSNLDFLKIWDAHINGAFTLMLIRNYNINIDPQDKEKFEAFYEGGVYTNGKVIDNQMIAFLFHRLFSFLDETKCIQSPDLLKQLAEAIAKMTDEAIKITNMYSGFFSLRFPARSFLMLTGRYLTFAHSLPEHFDDAIAKNIETMIKIYSHFEMNGAEETLNKMIAYIISLLSPKHITNLASFFQNLIQVFSTGSKIIPYLSEVVIENIPAFQIGQTNINKTNTFYKQFTSLYISSAEVLRYNKDLDKPVEDALLPVWNIVDTSEIKYRLLCYTYRYKSPYIFKINDSFQDDAFRSQQSPSASLYLIGMLEFVSAIIRIRPEISNDITNYNIIPIVLGCIERADPKKVGHYTYLVISALQMLVNIVEWAGQLFHIPENVTALFSFINKIEPQVRKQKNPQSSPSSGSQWNEQSKALISKIKDYTAHLTARVNIHMPCYDLFTKRLDSALEINENLVIQKLKIENPLIYHYTVGDSLLVSFIEKPDGTGPLVVFARGPFGKSIWKVKDDYQGNAPTPKLSSEIVPTILELPVSPDFQPLQVNGDVITIFPEINLETLKKEDNVIREKFMKDFSTWLDWDKFGYYYPFNYKAPYQRPRVVDFLTTMGIIDNQNQLNVNAQTDDAKVKEVIEKFDKLDNPYLIPIPILHVLPSDTSIEFNKDHHKRMTPLFKKFLQQIGTSYSVNDTSAVSHNIPELRTSVPMIPLTHALAALLTPSMAKTEDGAAMIASIQSVIHIIFNETNFELNTQKMNLTNECFMLVIKPTMNGLYHVKQITKMKEFISPFGDEQTLTPETISFNISLIIQLASSCTEKRMTSKGVIKQRKKIISELCSKPGPAELGPLASCIFSKKA